MMKLHNNYKLRDGTIDYDDGLEPLTLGEWIAATLVFILITTVIIAMVGSIIWGAEGFVELLASFF